jgi:hypothetical protein
MSEYYFIKSHLNDFVLGVKDNNTIPGTSVSPYPKTGAVGQQWRIDTKSGTIRNRLNDYCMDMSSGQLAVNPRKKAKAAQKWIRRFTVIASGVNDDMVLDIEGSNEEVGAKVIEYPRNGGPNQTWTFIHADN